MFPVILHPSPSTVCSFFSFGCCLYPECAANFISTAGNLQQRLASKGDGKSLAKSLDMHVGLQITRKSCHWDFLCLCCVWERQLSGCFSLTGGGRSNKVFLLACFYINLLLISVQSSSLSLFNCTGLPLHSAGENVLCLYCSEITGVISTLQGYLENPFFSRIPPPLPPFSRAADAVVISSLSSNARTLSRVSWG